MSILIDFKQKQIEHTCNECKKVQNMDFDQFKDQQQGIVCTPCENKDENGVTFHDWKTCTHCDNIEGYNLYCFVLNFELHDNPREMQVAPSVWEDNRNYHILRRMLEHNKEYEDVKDEPDLYESVHKIVGKKEFKKVWREHEREIKNMKEYLDENSK